MGFFSTPEPQAVELPKLSQERIKAIFDRDDIKYFVDSEGDLGGMWDNNVFYFMLRGQMNEILFIQGRYSQTIPNTRLEEVREILNTWNREKIWPKAYYRVNDEGTISVFGEHASDWEDGVTDEQLQLTITCALSTTHSLFNNVVEELGL